MCAPCCGGSGSRRAALRLTPAATKLTPASRSNPTPHPFPPLPQVTITPGSRGRRDAAFGRGQLGLTGPQRGREGGWEAGWGWWEHYQRAHLRPRLRFPPFIVFGRAASWCARGGKRSAAPLVHTNMHATGCVLNPTATACAGARPLPQMVAGHRKRTCV